MAGAAGHGPPTSRRRRLTEQFLTIIDRLVDLDAYERENAVRLDDPDLRRFPFLYALEVGYMYMTEPEVNGLRDYLLAGGFLMLDDFWGSAEWANFEAEIRRVLPEYPIVEIPLDHPVFTTFYNIDEIVQVPNLYNAQGGPTWQRDGITPHVRGIFDEQGRLMVMINWTRLAFRAIRTSATPGSGPSTRTIRCTIRPTPSRSRSTRSSTR